MKQKTDLTLRLGMVAIILLLGVIALRPYFEVSVKAETEPARFDHISIVSTMFIWKGQSGLLLLDRRNGNVWFVQKSNDESKANPFDEPLFLIRMPFEKLDQLPRGASN